MFEFKVVYRESWVCFESSWERSSRSVTNNKWYSSTFQANHFVSQQSFAKILTCPRTKITFPTLFFLGILKSCQDRPNHTSTLGWKRVPCLYSACTHVHRTYTDLSGHTLRMGKADDRERSKLKSLPSISLRALRHSPFNLLLLRSELFLTISVPLSTNSTHSVEHCFLKKVEQNKAFFLLIS